MAWYKFTDVSDVHAASIIKGDEALAVVRTGNLTILLQRFGGTYRPHFRSSHDDYIVILLTIFGNNVAREVTRNVTTKTLTFRTPHTRDICNSEGKLRQKNTPSHHSKYACFPEKHFQSRD